MTLIRTFLDEQSEYIWGPLAEPATTIKHAEECRNKLEVFLAFNDNESRHLEDIKSSDIIDFCRHLKAERDLSSKTLNRYRSAISKVFSAAVEYETISKKDRPQFKQSKEITQTPRTFTVAEIEQITEFLENQPHKWLLHLFAIGHMTGMRKSEIWRTTKDNIEWLDDDGTRVMTIRITNTKNGYDRHVPISVEVLKHFEAVDWAFPKTVDGNFPAAPYRAAWAEIKRVIGKGDPRVLMKQTRHTAASTLCNAMGANILLVANFMGHKSVSTTQKYVHEKPSSLANMAAGLATQHQQGV